MAGAAHLIVQIAGVYARQGRNFLTTILRLSREREVLRVVADQVGPPTWAGAVAEATATMVRQQPGPAASGIYHLASPNGCSWHDLAAAILREDPAPADRVVRRLEAIPAASHPSPAQRPRFSMLDSRRAASMFGVALPTREAQLQGCLRSQ